MTKKEVFDMLYKVIDFINGNCNDRHTVVPNSYYYVVPSRKESGFLDRYYINADKQVNGSFWYCSMIGIDLNKNSISLSKDCIYQDDWLKSLFKASEVTEIDKGLFILKLEETEDILKPIAKQ